MNVVEYIARILNITPARAAFDWSALVVNVDNPTKVGNIGQIFLKALEYMLVIAGILAVVALLYSGLRYITAGADEKAVETGRKNIIWAVTGIIAIMLAFAIVQWVNNALNYKGMWWSDKKDTWINDSTDMGGAHTVPSPSDKSGPESPTLP